MMQKHKRRAPTLMTLVVLLLIVGLSLVLQDATTVTAREMLHPCPEAGEDHTQEQHDNTCSAHTPTPRPPTSTPTVAPTDPPANFRVTDIGINSISLQWGRLRSHLGITSAYISVYQQPDGSIYGEYKHIGRYNADRSGGSLRVSNLKSDTYYQFFLLYNTPARLVLGGSLFVSTQIDPTLPTPTPTPTLVPRPTDAPVNFSVTDIGATGVILRWGAAPSNRGITSAEIIRYEHNGSEYRYSGYYGASLPVSGSTILGATGLKPDTLYKFTLRFLDVDGDIVMSKSVTARTLAAHTPTPTSTLLAGQPTPTPTSTPLAGQPTPTPASTPLATPTDAPAYLRISGVGPDSIALQWRAAPRNRGIVSGEISTYEYLDQQSTYQYIRRDTAGLSAGNLRVSLKSDTLYKFVLVYRNRDYEVVMRLAATARTLAWQTPTPASTLLATQTPTTTPAPAQTTPPPPAATAPPTQTAIPTVSASAKPVLNILSASETAIELGWSPVDGAVRYEPRAFTREDEYIYFDYTEPNATTFTHDGLVPDRNYYYWVRGVTAEGEVGPWSVRLNATASDRRSASVFFADTPIQGPTATPSATPAATATPTWTATLPPEATATPLATPAAAATPARTAAPPPEATAPPTQTAAPTVSASAQPVLNIISSSGTTIGLSWTPVEGADHYDLRAFTLDDGWEILGGPALTGTTFEHTGLVASRDYYYWVRAINADGEPGAWSVRTGEPDYK